MDTTICPNCGATLFVEDPDEEYIVCEYCGTRVYFHYDRNFQDGFESYARQYRQQARQAERSRKAYERRQTFQKASSCCKDHPYLCMAGIAAVLFVIIVLGFWLPRENKRRAELSAHQAELASLEQEQEAYSHLAQGEAQVPEIPGLVQDITKIKIDMIDYRIVKRAFTNAGFTNVTTTTQEYAHGWNNLVYEVTIDGVPQLSVGEWIPADTPIVISYYTYGADASSSSLPTSWDDIANNAIDRINDLADSTYQALDSLAEKYGASVSRPEN